MNNKKGYSALLAVCILGSALIGGCAHQVTGSKAQSSIEVSNAGLLGLAVLDDKVPNELRSYYLQKPKWTQCDSKYVCAKVQVPLDYANPQKANIEIALKVHNPTNKKHNLSGAVFINPGGPGGSGIEILDHFDQFLPAKFHENYALVGFDPRGVGQSTAIKCISDKRMDELVALSSDELTLEGITKAQEIDKEIGKSCAQNSKELLAHVDTVSAAKDLDILRHVVGDKEFNYLGFSYGTYLGSIYASLFPQKVGRMVLDGAMNPAISAEQTGAEQAVGFEKAMEAFLQWCDTQSECPVQGSTEEKMQAVADFLTQLETNPIEVASEKRKITSALGFTGIIAALYSQDAWPGLKMVIGRAMLHKDGSGIMKFADLLVGRKDNGTYDNSTPANWAINCLDYPAEGTPEIWLEHNKKITQEAKHFGKFMAGGQGICANWPVKSHNKRVALDVTTKNPIVIIGTTGDPATPYAWAKALHQQIKNSVLVTWEGVSHTAFSTAGDCITNAVLDFWLQGKVPADGLQCK